MRHMLFPCGIALVVALASSCSRAESTERPDASRELLVRTAEFSFSAPDTIAAGYLTIRLVNDGAEMHHMQLVRLGEGHSFADFRESAAAGNPIPAWVTPVGGPNASSPGGDARVAVDLAAGRYAMLCLIPSFYDRTAHYHKGMVRQLVVVPSPGGNGKEPAADGRIVLSDYAFAISPTLRSGRHTLRVENAADQPHELVIERLIPGKTMDDLMAWAKRMEGPPPVEPNGGTTVIAPGGVNLMTATFVPGTYVLVCFAADRSDGKSHLAHGMLRQIEVE
jgi:hypothetical protein